MLLKRRKFMKFALKPPSLALKGFETQSRGLEYTQSRVSIEDIRCT